MTLFLTVTYETESERETAESSWLGSCVDDCGYEVVPSMSSSPLLPSRPASFVGVARASGYLCVEALVAELKVRPETRFVWGSTTGKKRCGHATMDDFKDAGIFVASRDVALLAEDLGGGDSLSEVTVFDDPDRVVDLRTTRVSPPKKDTKGSHFPRPTICDAGLLYVANAGALEDQGEKKKNLASTLQSGYETWPGKVVAARRNARPPILTCPAGNDDAAPPMSSGKKSPSGSKRSLAEAPPGWRRVDECCGAPSPECAAFRGRALMSSSSRSGDNNTKKKPTVLASFPGSGNTWVRLMLEYASGTLTGSLYNDDELKRVLPAEGNTENVLAVKAHLTPDQYLSRLPRTAKIVLLTRHPFKAIWADFQRRAGVLEEATAHVHVIRDLGPGLKRVFDGFATCMACKWALYALAHATTRVPVYYARYEDFLEDAPKAISDISKFLGFFHDNNDKESQRRERLHCAPRLAFDPNVKRNVTLGGKKKRLTADDVFVGPIACAAWERVVANDHSRALVAVMKYDPPPNCHGPPTVSAPTLKRDCADLRTGKWNCFHTVLKTSLDTARQQDSKSANKRPQKIMIPSTTASQRQRQRRPGGA